MGDESYIDTSCQRGLDNSVPPNYLSNMQAPKKTHKFREDQLREVEKGDVISNLIDLKEYSAPPGFKIKRFEDSVLYYNLVFGDKIQSLTILESMQFDTIFSNNQQKQSKNIIHKNTVIAFRK